MTFNLKIAVGCAKALRLMALKAMQDFPAFPHKSLIEEKEFPTKIDYLPGLSRPPMPSPSPSISQIAFSSNNLPKCRTDRPDLYAARQCNALDCFCVNVTTGDFLPGTRTNREDLVDCSTGEIFLLCMGDESVSL